MAPAMPMRAPAIERDQAVRSTAGPGIADDFASKSEGIIL